MPIEIPPGGDEKKQLLEQAEALFRTAVDRRVKHIKGGRFRKLFENVDEGTVRTYLGEVYDEGLFEEFPNLYHNAAQLLSFELGELITGTRRGERLGLAPKVMEQMVAGDLTEDEEVTLQETQTKLGPHPFVIKEELGRARTLALLLHRTEGHPEQMARDIFVELLVEVSMDAEAGIPDFLKRAAEINERAQIEAAEMELEAEKDDELSAALSRLAKEEALPPPDEERVERARVRWERLKGEVQKVLGRCKGFEDVFRFADALLEFSAANPAS